MPTCPNCRAAVDYGDDIELGRVLECPRCHTPLEVAATNPVQLVDMNTGDVDLKDEDPEHSEPEDVPE